MFKKLLNGVFFLVASSSLVSCGNNNDNKWEVYKSGDGGFSINMPAKPEKSEKVEVTPFGKQKVHFITWRPGAMSIDKFKLFQVSYTDCPDRFFLDTFTLLKVMDSSIKLRKVDFSEKEFKDETIDFNGYPAKAFIFDEDKNNEIVMVKQFYTNHRRYDLCVVVKRNQGTNNEVNEFFNSFTIMR
jgi:hypothetical protein